MAVERIEAPPAPRILVVEDNGDLAYGLRNNLEIEGYAVDVAADGQEGLQRARTSEPDLIILDLMLPELDGYRVLQALRREGRRMPVLVLTARGEETDKVLGLRLGADDYVTKPFGVLELLARVEALLRRARMPSTNGAAAEAVGDGNEGGGGQDVRDGGRIEFGDVVVEPSARTVHKAGQEVSLTPKELDLLLALVERDGAVASRIELMRDVWGHRAAIVSRTVDTHISELRKKLEDDPASPVHILTVHKAGYRFTR